MKITKIVLAMALVALMVLGLVACGGAPEDPTQGTPTTPPVEKASIIYMVDGASFATDEVEKGTAATAIADPTKTGYQFEGWFLTGAETAFDFSTPIDATTILNAKFSVITYSITYNLGEYAGEDDCKNPNMLYFSSGDLNPASKTSYTVEEEITIKKATYPNKVCTWKDQDGNIVTSTKGFAKDLILTANWSKAPYIDVDFESHVIHYCDYNDAEIGVKALDGTFQKYDNDKGHTSRPNACVESTDCINDDGVLAYKGEYSLIDLFKNSQNPMYIKQETGSHGNCLWIILDHDLADGSQTETYYFDKNKDNIEDHKDTTKVWTRPSVYNDCSNTEPYNVAALCYLQNKNVDDDVVKMSFDFYQSAVGANVISLYIRDETKTYGKDFNGNRLNLAAIKPDGTIAYGAIDAANAMGRTNYVDGNGDKIATVEEIGQAEIGKWHTMAFIMELFGDAGAQYYMIDIELDGEIIAHDLKLVVNDLIWGAANEFMVFGGGAQDPSVLDHDVIFKFDNFKLEAYED